MSYQATRNRLTEKCAVHHNANIHQKTEIHSSHTDTKGGESPHSKARIQTHDLLVGNHVEALYNAIDIEQQTVCYS